MSGKGKKGKKATKEVVRWSWQSDTGPIYYPAVLNAKLEDARTKKLKRVPVDDERFVDIPNMLQRRFDDESKRRSVNREVVEVTDDEAEDAGKALADEVLCFVGAPATAKRQRELEEMAKNAGALLCASYMRRVTTVVLRGGSAGAAGHEDELQQMLDNKVTVVDEQWLVDCDAKDAAVDKKKYLLTAVPGAAKRKPAAADDDDDDAGGSSSSTTTTTSSGAAAKKKLRADDEESGGAPTAVVALAAGSHALVAGTRWRGESVPAGGGDEKFPFDFHVETVADAEDEPAAASAAGGATAFTGRMVWTTLSNTTTKMRGTVQTATGAVQWEEYAVISGDDVDVPNKYQGRFTTRDAIGGSYTDSQAGTGRVQLTATASLTAAITPAAALRGVCYSPFAFEMVVDTRVGDKFTGTVTWPSLNNTKTRVSGTLSAAGDVISWTEDTVISGSDVEVPNAYRGRLAGGGAVVGSTVDASQGRGKFELFV